MKALTAGKSVVTTNKELIAAHGPELFATAEAQGVDLLFEASVAGGIPLIRPLRESLAGDRIRRVMGIVNGTTNYILTRMAEEGSSFADALAEAQRLGYAEPDPTADIEGHDAAAKAVIIATIAFGARVEIDDVFREGITQVTEDDIESAAILGYRVKLLAVAEELEGGIAIRVAPGDGAGRSIRSPGCATRSTRCSSRARRSASSCSTGAVPGRARRRRPCSAISSTP